MSSVPDPFEKVRRDGPVMPAEFQGETLPMILRLKDVRAAARDWQTYSSAAACRVPIPSEEDLRTVRQFPIEADPPEHGDYRKLVEPFFLRPKQPEVKAQIEAVIDRLVAASVEAEEIEVVEQLAVPLQSRALTFLLNVDESEAETWIAWGIHVFHEQEGGVTESPLEAYTARKFHEAESTPGGDFFSALNQAEFQGRKLTFEEKQGYANLAFAGGRDTIIHTASRIIAHFAEHPEALAWLREHPEAIKSASEEFFRVFIPLTHIGRVCPHATDVHGHEVPEDGRVSLCWASANRDEEFFENPHEIQLDRRPNPHVAFGFGIHNCLGAHHARVVTQALLKSLVAHVDRIDVLAAEELIERRADYERVVGYSSLNVRMTARSNPTVA